jgi:hypothetical protein
MTDTAIAPSQSTSVTPEEHVEAVKGFMNQCLRVKYTKTGLPKSKQVSADVRQAMADAAGVADPTTLSGSKRLFKSGKDAHPIIGDVNEWERMVDKWRNSFTFSMAADESADVGELRRAKAERLVRADDVEAFEDGLVKLEAEGVAICKKLQAEYDEVMAMEKAKLGKQFKAGDYPAKEDVYQLVVDPQAQKSEELCILRIGKRHYSEVTASVRLPKKVLEKMTVQAAELMNQSLEVAVEDVSKELVDTFKILSARLVDRIKIKPRFGTSIYRQVGAEAEVLGTTKDSDDKLTVTVSYHKEIDDEERPGRKKRQKVSESFGPMTEQEYQDLRPEAMDETKKMHVSVVERFGDYLEQFVNLKSKLGAYGEHMDEALDQLRELYHRAATGSKKQGAEGVIASIKGSSQLRAEMKEGLDFVCGKLTDVADEVRKVRRKLHSGIAGKVAQLQAKAKAKKEAAHA